MAIAAQAYTIRSVMATDVPGSLHRLREVGYEHVELAGLHGLGAAEMARTLADAGLSAVSAHVPWAAAGEGDPAELADDMGRLGIVDVVVPSMPPRWREGGEAAYREFGRLLGERAAMLRERSLRLHYHNHSFELEQAHGDGTGLDTLIAESGPEVGFELDLAWLRGGGADPAEWVRRVPAGRVRLVHMKDVRFEDGKAIDTEVGRGVVDWPPVTAACRAAGVATFIVEQDRPAPDPFDSLITSLAATRRLLED